MNRESTHTFRNELAGTTSTTRAPWLLGALREIRLPAILAALALAALCLAFLEVVSGAVEQGRARREAQVSQADATWRCNAQRDRSQRSDCLARLGLTAATGQALANSIDLATADQRDLP